MSAINHLFYHADEVCKDAGREAMRLYILNDILLWNRRNTNMAGGLQTGNYVQGPPGALYLWDGSGAVDGDSINWARTLTEEGLHAHTPGVESQEQENQIEIAAEACAVGWLPGS